MLGFVGGSGIYEALPLSNTRTVEVSTPYGDPSAPLTVGELAGEEIAFVPRHGTDHQFTPSEVPYRANVYALKELGAERVVASNAVGGLQEAYPPRTLVIPDQFFDRTRDREYTFFGDGVVVHQEIAHPYCPHLSDHLAASGDEATDADCVRGGTHVCIEGPQYSTKAESEWFRDQGWEIIGMTTVPEAKLAREAELCYATIAGVTDWGVWKGAADDRLQEVLANATANEDAIKELVEHAVRNLPDERDCDCGQALDGTVNTPTDAIPEATRERVDLLLGDYL